MSMWLPQNYEAPAGCQPTGREKTGPQLTLVREWSCSGLGLDIPANFYLPPAAITGLRRMESAGVSDTKWTTAAFIVGGIALGGLGLGLIAKKLRKRS